MEYFLAFVIALALNFVGMIPPGMITLKIVSVRFEKSFKEALLFSFGVAFVELFQTMATLRFSSIFVKFFNGHVQIKWAAVVVLIVLAGNVYFSKPRNPQDIEENELKNVSKKTSFLKGAFLSLFNVLKYPFWIAQGVYFINNGLIKNDFQSVFIYSIGATLGAFAMYFLYVKLGKLLLDKFEVVAKNINKVLGIFFLFLAILQLINIFY